MAGFCAAGFDPGGAGAAVGAVESVDAGGTELLSVPGIPTAGGGELPSLVHFWSSARSARLASGEVLAGRIALREIEIGMDFGAEAVGAGDRRQQRGQRVTIAGFDLVLDIELLV